MASTPNKAPPSGNVAESETLAGVISFAFRKMQQQTDDMLPAKVVSYDRETNRAKVQPLIAFVDTASQQLSRAPVGSVPVLQLGGGGFVLSFPIQPGDLGWIKANDRDISAFKQSLAPSAPPTQRQKSFEDAMFIPDTMFKSVTIHGEDDESVVLQSLSGGARISISGDKIKLTAPEIEFDTPLLSMSNSGGTITIGGINFLTHTHNGVDPGGGNSGGPNP